ncbi:sugar phosphotransferase [Pelomyxa schiedti]|nr:sugar phosphotransferase [Pelomyxa schiedti]
MQERPRTHITLTATVAVFVVVWVSVNIVIWYAYSPDDGDDGRFGFNDHNAFFKSRRGAPANTGAPARGNADLGAGGAAVIVGGRADEDDDGGDEGGSAAREACDVVDVVYTWVNGSDPAHEKLLASHKNVGSAWKIMFRDYGILRFSMRSIEKHMPWARNIILVTNGQIPTWANISSPRLRWVTHDQIFPHTKDLPTFNSNAIEAHLSKIPGIAPCFIYMNDDFFLMQDVEKSMFVDTKTGQLKLFMENAQAPEYEKGKTNGWFRSIAYSNDLINQYYHPEVNETVKHNYVGHYCYFIDKEIADTMYKRWQVEFDRTSTNRFRAPDDTAFPFLHANVALEEFGATRNQGVPNGGGAWTSNHTKNVATWNRIISRKLVCVVLQDRIDLALTADEEIKYLEQLMCSVFPTKSTVERHEQPNPCSSYK